MSDDLKNLDPSLLADDGKTPNPVKLVRPLVITFLAPGGAKREEAIEEIAIRRPTGAELLLVDQYQMQPMKLTMELIAALAEPRLTIKNVHRLDAEDISRLGKLAFAKLDDGPATGGDA